MKKKVLLSVLVVLALGCPIALWLADRPMDEPPRVHEGAGHIAFHPKFGPRTPEQVQEYLEGKAVSYWGGRKMTPADRQSSAGQAAWKNAVNTLQRRWGLTPSMSQEEIDAVREQQEQVWAFIENTRTSRYKIRSWLGLNK